MNTFTNIAIGCLLGTLMLVPASVSRGDERSELVPPPAPVGPGVDVVTGEASSPPAAYVARYYRRPYVGVRYGWEPRYYPYRSYYYPDYGYYGGPRYYRYYGTPRFGYYDYPYGGSARVGPIRIYWR